MVSPQEIGEIDAHFRQRLADSKLRQAARGKNGRIASHNARIAKGGWRTLTGANFFIHEAKHPGTRPFAIGLATIFALSLWGQTKFSDDMRTNSLYYQDYHAKDKKH